MKHPVAIVSGATATGKTALGIALGKKYGLEIINFDSLLFYRELHIGTARPSADEMEGVPHHLMGQESIKAPINAAQFSQLAKDKISSLHRRGVVPLLVGGSAFYLNALLQGMGDEHPPSQQARGKSHALYEREGISPFRQILREYDPPNFHKLHENDHYRIRRAVEYYWSTERPFSSHSFRRSPPSNIHHWNLCHIYLHIEKHRHWPIIHHRSQRMVENGLVDEMADLLAQGFTGREKALQSIGYREAQQFLNGAIATRKQLMERIAISTRQLAKAQKTFFSRMAVKRECNPLEDVQLIHQHLDHLLQN